MKKLNDWFIGIADKVSFGMGSPTNIIFWILMVLIWIALGALNPLLFTNGSFLPSWFTSTGWNFPLNTITTLAELYIGFLVAAATNRAERELRKIIEHTENVVDSMDEQEKKIVALEQQILDMENKIIDKLNERN